MDSLVQFGIATVLKMVIMRREKSFYLLSQCVMSQKAASVGTRNLEGIISHLWLNQRGSTSGSFI